jgi:hypothetical protein
MVSRAVLPPRISTGRQTHNYRRPSPAPTYHAPQLQQSQGLPKQTLKLTAPGTHLRLRKSPASSRICAMGATQDEAAKRGVGGELIDVGDVLTPVAYLADDSLYCARQRMYEHILSSNYLVSRLCYVRRVWK